MSPRLKSVTLRALGFFAVLGSLWILARWYFDSGSAGVGPEQQVGRLEDGSIVLPTNQILTPAGRQVEFQGRPTAVTLAPDLGTAALLNGAYKAIILVDLETGAVKQEFDAAGSSASFNGIVYSKDGKKLYASQANGHLILASVAGGGELALDELVNLNLPEQAESPIPHPGTYGNPNPGGLALSDDDTTLYIVLNRNNTLGVFDLADRKIVAEIAVGNAPDDVVILGDRAYVSNRGGRPAEDGDFTVDSSGTPIVADEDSAFSITGTVSVVDLESGVEVQTIDVGLQPAALLLDGRRLFVANTNSDTVSVIDVETDRVIHTIAIQPFPGALQGSSPNALAMVDGEHLLVSLGRSNCLAVYALKNHLYGAVEFQGLIPTGWYPAGIAVDTTRRRVIVVNNKGVGSMGPERIWEAPPGAEPTRASGKWVLANMGSASILEWTEFSNWDTLQSQTNQVLENNNWMRLSTTEKLEEPRAESAAQKPEPIPVPLDLGDPSVFKHVFYIIKENRTYDQVFGDLPQGNGDPDLVQFGREVTPNQHALAEQFVLFDNMYDAGSKSADAHQWITQAFVVDYLEKSQGGEPRTYPFNGGDSLAYPQTGFLWENAISFGKSVRVYGEYVNGLKVNGVELGAWAPVYDKEGNPHPAVGGSETADFVQWSDFYDEYQILRGLKPGNLRLKVEAHSDIPSLERIISKDYPPYNHHVPDVYRAEVFFREFDELVENSNLPDLVIMVLITDHTEGTKPHYPTPYAFMADNDLALGRIVEKISHSPYWKDSVIFVIEDDAQNGVDHVDGHRTIAQVISPYTKRGVVDSRYYTQLSITRTIEQILGLPPMTQMDMAVDPRAMKNVFVNEPDFTPFVALPNAIPLDSLNPPLASLQGIRKQWAAAMYELDFSKPDAADEELLNRVTWYSTMGYDRPFPGDERVLGPDEVHP